MARLLNHLTRLGLALAIVVGTMAQLPPTGIAAADMGACGDAAGACGVPQPPCHRHLPGCVDHVGCTTAFTLPAPAASLVVAIDWTPLAYDLTAPSLSGISVEPELSPPILVL